jgi:hypothetical protein
VYLVSNGVQSYVGSRTSKVPPHEDVNYLGSSTDRYFRSTIIKKFILKTFKSRREACEYEANLHHNWSVDVNPNFANKAKACSEEHKYGFEIPTGYKWTSNQRKRFSKYKKKNPSILPKDKVETIKLKLSLKKSEGLFREKIKLRPYNNFSKLEKHLLIHHTGLSFYGTLMRFYDLFDVTYSGASELLLGKISFHRGWSKVQRLGESRRDKAIPKREESTNVD